MQCCRTCEHLEKFEDTYFCIFPVVLPEVMQQDSFLENEVQDLDQFGGDCDCYELDKSLN